jgi:hypothetical protein
MYTTKFRNLIFGNYELSVTSFFGNFIWLSKVGSEYSIHLKAGRSGIGMVISRTLFESGFQMVRLLNDRDWHKIEFESWTRFGFRMGTVRVLAQT